jgi:hypothetical protein
MIRIRNPNQRGKMKNNIDALHRDGNVVEPDKVIKAERLKSQQRD